MKIKNISFTSKIVGMIIGTTVAISVVSLVDFNRVLKSAEAEQRSALKNVGEGIVNGLAAQFYERYGDVQAFAANSIFFNGGANKEAWVRTLNQYAYLYGIYDIIVFSDTSGKVLAVNSLDAAGKPIKSDKIYNHNMANEPSVKAALEGKFLVNKEGGMNDTAFGDFQKIDFASEAYGQDRFATVFSAVVKNEKGQMVGVITNIANASWITREINKSYTHMKAIGQLNSEYFLLNKDGKPFAAYKPKAEGNTIEASFGEGVVINNHGWLQDVLGQESGTIDIPGITGSEPVTLGFAPVGNEFFPKEVGWTVGVAVPTTDLLGNLRALANTFYLISMITWIVCVILGVVIARWFGKQLASIAAKIERSSQETNKLGDSLAGASNALSSTSHEQAAAIQESVSALAEMASMIAQTTQNATLSLASANEAIGEAGEGKKIMARLEDAMKSIQVANKKLQDISTIIQSISVKTNVINDIVFKTQLLSFNASIEAARAGQHGKGFAVVAEEVGNLAELSGTAARDIESLLAQSQLQVKETLDMINFRVAEAGNVTQHAGHAFTNIASQVMAMNGQIKSITEAAQQQELGIQQTNAAMKQLQTASQENSRSAQKSEQSAQVLSQESKNLVEATHQLWGFIRGNNQQVKSKPMGRGFFFWFKRFGKKSDKNKIAATVDKIRELDSVKVNPMESPKTEEIDQFFKKAS